MPKIVENATAREKRATDGEGKAIRRFFPPAANKPEPVRPQEIVSPQLGTLIEAVQKLNTSLTRKEKPAIMQITEFTVTERDEKGRIMKFSITERGKQ